MLKSQTHPLSLPSTTTKLIILLLRWQLNQLQLHTITPQQLSVQHPSYFQQTYTRTNFMSNCEIFSKYKNMSIRSFIMWCHLLLGGGNNISKLASWPLSTQYWVQGIIVYVCAFVSVFVRALATYKICFYTSKTCTKHFRPK